MNQSIVSPASVTDCPRSISSPAKSPTIRTPKSCLSSQQRTSIISHLAKGSFTLDNGGSFEVESHHLKKIIVILNARRPAGRSPLLLMG